MFCYKYNCLLVLRRSLNLIFPFYLPIIEWNNLLKIFFVYIKAVSMEKQSEKQAKIAVLDNNVIKIYKTTGNFS